MNIKKILIRAVTLIAVLSMLFTAVACDEQNPGENPDTPERYGEGTSDVEIENFVHGFIEADAYHAQETTIADTKSNMEFKVDTVYYCFMEFEIVARNLNDGTSLMDVLVRFDNLAVADGTTEEAGTGNATDMIFTDAATGTNSKETTLVYKIPSDPDKVKKIKILVRIQPVTVGQSHISVSFNSTVDGEFKILGESADGFTKNLTIDRVQIEAPVITVDKEALKVQWKHVKHADYYLIYLDNKSIKFEGVDKYTGVGSDLEFDLTQFVELDMRYGTVKVQACSNSDNFMKSTYSNSVAGVSIG